MSERRINPITKNVFELVADYTINNIDYIDAVREDNKHVTVFIKKSEWKKWEKAQ